MNDKSTSIAAGLMVFQVMSALVMFRLAWILSDKQAREIAWGAGGFSLLIVSFTLLFFFVFKENRRPTVVFLVITGLFLLPWFAFVIAHAATGYSMERADADAPVYVIFYVLFVSFVFIRMATWGVTVPPLSGVAPANPTGLRKHLLEMGATSDIPFTITPGKRPNELIMDWKYADATWLDFMRVHKVSYLTRFVIRLDESSHTARVREYQSSFDASGGVGGLSLAFKAQWGIMLYDYKHETVYGIQIENGRPVAKLSYTYTFDINEMREPLQKLITQNGWTYKGVLLFAPWLTG